METNIESLSYLGSLDDVVYRHPWREGQICQDTMTRHLINNFIYGHVGVINDGYLLANPLITSHYETAKSRDRSLILNLIDTGDLRVFSRNGQSFDLVAGLEKSASDGQVRHHQKLMKADSYERAIKPTLNSISKKLPDKGVSFPNYHLGQTFYALLTSLLDKDESLLLYSNTCHSELEKALKYFDKERGDQKYESARGHWEDLCFEGARRGLFEREEQASHELMELANKCYHMAYGFGMSVSIEESTQKEEKGFEARVTTGFVNGMFGEYLDDDGEYESPPSTNELCNLLMTAPPEFWMEDYSQIRRIGCMEEFIDLRKNYVDSLVMYCKGGCEFREAEKIMHLYRDYLVDEIGHKHFQSKRNNSFDRGASETLKAGIKSVAKAIVGMPYGLLIDAIFVGLKYRGVSISDRIFTANARRALQNEALEAQGSPEDSRTLLTKVGLSAPIVNRDKARRFFDNHHISKFP